MTEIRLLMTANYAEVQDGNLYALALGWNWTRSPVALVMVCRVEAPESTLAADQPATLQIQDSDGLVIHRPKARCEMHPSPVSASGAPPTGVEQPVWLIIKCDPLELDPGRYVFQLEYDGQVAAYPFTIEAPLT
jgi:hypothetical protein